MPISNSAGDSDARLSLTVRRSWISGCASRNEASRGVSHSTATPLEHATVKAVWLRTFITSSVASAQPTSRRCTTSA